MPIEYLLRKKHFPGVLYEQKTELNCVSREGNAQLIGICDILKIMNLSLITKLAAIKFEFCSLREPSVNISANLKAYLASLWGISDEFRVFKLVSYCHVARKSKGFPGTQKNRNTTACFVLVLRHLMDFWWGMFFFFNLSIKWISKSVLWGVFFSWAKWFGIVILQETS